MQRYFVQTKIANHLILDPSDVHHLKNVMRNQSGDTIECIYQNTLYICKIDDPTQNQVTIIKEIPQDNELQPHITIAISLVKEQKMDLILQKLTELGISTIIPLKTERSIIKLDTQKFLTKKARWQKICKEASEQSKRTQIPQITDLMTIKDLKDLNYSEKYLCSPSTSNLLSTYLKTTKTYDKIIFVIGPEGGITPEEEQLLNSYGYTSISLGKRIMRVETAAIYIASIINFCNMR